MIPQPDRMTIKDVTDQPPLQDCRNINHETNEGKRLILI